MKRRTGRERRWERRNWERIASFTKDRRKNGDMWGRRGKIYRKAVSEKGM